MFKIRIVLLLWPLLYIHTYNHVRTLEGRKGIKRTNPSTVPRQMQLISMSAQHTFIVGDGDSNPSL